LSLFSTMKAPGPPTACITQRHQVPLAVINDCSFEDHDVSNYELLLSRERPLRPLAFKGVAPLRTERTRRAAH
jgi:hypothetical protein